MTNRPLEAPVCVLSSTVMTQTVWTWFRWATIKAVLKLVYILQGLHWPICPCRSLIVPLAEWTGPRLSSKVFKREQKEKWKNHN